MVNIIGKFEYGGAVGGQYTKLCINSEIEKKNEKKNLLSCDFATELLSDIKIKVHQQQGPSSEDLISSEDAECSVICGWK